MLHIVKQYRKMLFSFLEAGFTGAENSSLTKYEGDTNNDGSIDKTELNAILSANNEKTSESFRKSINDFLKQNGDKITLSQANILFRSQGLEIIASAKDNAANITNIVLMTEREVDILSTAASNNIIASFDIKKDLKDKIKVTALQKALGMNVTSGGIGVFGPRTKKAYNEAISKIKSEVPETQFTDSKVPVSEQEVTNNNLKAVEEKIEKTETSVKNLEESLVYTQELNGKFSDYFFREDSGYSIEALIRRVSGNDKYAKILETREQYSNLLSTPQARQKLEDAVRFMTNQQQNDGLQSFQLDSVVKEAGKILPWLFGIYLGDIPLPFIKKLTAGADINKSVAFKNWIASGMIEDFDKYYKNHENQKDVNVLSNQYDLRGLITTLDIPESDKQQALAGRLENLSIKTQDLLKTYIAVRLIPDLEMLQRESYNAFERGEWYTLGGLFGLTVDYKYEKGNAILKTIKESKDKGETNLEIAEEIFALLVQEGDVKKAIKPSQRRNEYMKSVKEQDRVFGNIGELLKEGYPELKIVYFFSDINTLGNLGASEADKKAIGDLKIILDKKPIALKEIQDFAESNPNTMKFLKSIFNEKEMNSYLKSQIPQDKKLIFVDRGVAKHGEDLSGLDNQEALERAESTTTEKGSKISVLGSAYKSFLDKGGIVGISYEEFKIAFANKTNVDIGSMTNEPIINTGRKEHQKTLTSFQELATKFGDTTVFKLAPIVKEYSYYKDGSEVKEKVTYNLYMRPECSNPIIVPSTIETVSVKKVPEFDGQTYTQVSGKLPVIIPWAFLNGNGRGGSGNNPKDGGVSTNPKGTGGQIPSSTSIEVVNPIGQTTTNSAATVSGGGGFIPPLV